MSLLEQLGQLAERVASRRPVLPVVEAGRRPTERSMEAGQSAQIERLKEIVTFQGAAGMRHAPAYTAPSQPASPAKKGRPFSTSLYLYFLFRQAWPFFLLLLVVGLCLNYEYIAIGNPFLSNPADDVSDAGQVSLIQESSGSGSLVASQVADPMRNAQPKRRHEHAPIFGFIQFSSYRTGARTFAAVGLAGLMLRDIKQLGKCMWKEHAGGHRVEGKLQAFYPGEHHDLKYETIVILCNLDESTEHDTGGDLTMQIDGDDLLVYQEASGAFPVADPKPPFKHKLAYCSPPIHSVISARRLYEFIEYHIQQGVDYFIFYDMGGVDEEVMAMLEAYSELKMVEVVNARPFDAYNAWAHGSVLLINDCALRTRFTSKWVTVFEPAEYFTSEAGITLSALLETHVGKPYVSFGSRWWSLEKCLPDPENNKWAIERMIYHWPHIYCVNKDTFPRWEMCLDYFGFRKYAVDPRKVTALQIHRTEVPGSGGVDVDTDVARMNRWPGLLERTGKACNHIVQESEVIDWWVLESTVATVAQTARSKPTAQFRTRST